MQLRHLTRPQVLSFFFNANPHALGFLSPIKLRKRHHFGMSYFANNSF